MMKSDLRIGDRVRHQDRNYGVGTYTERAYLITRDRAKVGEVYIDFDDKGTAPVSAEYLVREVE